MKISRHVLFTLFLRLENRWRPCSVVAPASPRSGGFRGTVPPPARDGDEDPTIEGGGSDRHAFLHTMPGGVPPPAEIVVQRNSKEPHCRNSWMNRVDFLDEVGYANLCPIFYGSVAFYSR